MTDHVPRREMVPGDESCKRCGLPLPEKPGSRTGLETCPCGAVYAYGEGPWGQWRLVGQRSSPNEAHDRAWLGFEHCFCKDCATIP